MKGFCFAWMLFLFAHNIKLSAAEIIKDVDYDKHRHPLDVGRDHLDVNMSFDLSEIRDIDEVNGVMTIKFTYKRVWHDRRINFTNIKEGQRRILPEERNTIWLPWTIFDNLKHNNSMLKSDKLDSCLARQADNGSSKHSSESKMLIEYEKERIGEFMCDYDMFWFPFDSQSCGIKLYQKEDDVHLVPDGLTYGGPQNLEQYTVTGLRMCHTNIQVRQTLTLTLDLL